MRKHKGSRLIRYGEVTMSLSEWARELGMSRLTLANRIKEWGNLERCFNEPINHKQRIFPSKINPDIAIDLDLEDSNVLAKEK